MFRSAGPHFTAPVVTSNCEPCHGHCTVPQMRTPSDSGPPRRYYRITTLGHDTLQAWAGAWRATRDSVDSVLAPIQPGKSA